jgi:hypothetical protein
LKTGSPELDALLQKARIANEVIVSRECLMQIERELTEAAEHHIHADAAVAAIKAAFVANEPIPPNKPVRKPRR